MNVTDNAHPALNLEKLHTFLACHTGNNMPIAFVTSGGTVTKLEKNTVRFIDNFSTGRRGALAVEFLVKQGYAVVFLTRPTCLQPFLRVLDAFTSKASFFDSLELTNRSTLNPHLALKQSFAGNHVLINAYLEYKRAKEYNLIFPVHFVTVEEYLALFESISKELGSLEKKCLFFLAAAVSDFYLPADLMADHKMQSHQEFNCSGNSEYLDLRLCYTPKRLQCIRKMWAKNAYIVSFKLETDSTLLLDKARSSLSKNGQNLVIANLLDTRHERVVFVQPDSDPIVLTNPALLQSSQIDSLEIDTSKSSPADLFERFILEKVVSLHTQYYAPS